MHNKVIAAIIAEHWPLDTVRVARMPASHKEPLFQRDTLSVQSEQGTFVVKVFDDAFALGLVAPTVEQINQQLYSFDYLAARGYPYVPALLKTRAGHRFTQAQGRTLYVMERVQGVQSEDSVQTWRALGQAAASLSAFKDYPYAYPICVSGVVQELTVHAKSYSFKAAFLSLAAGLVVLEGQPASLIHAEINTANSVHTDGGGMYLLDWDAVGHGPSVLMAGYPLLVAFLNEWTLTFHADWATAFYEAYTAGVGMTDIEKELTFQAALLHAMRYLKYDPNRRWARIQFALANKAQMLAALPTR